MASTELLPSWTKLSSSKARTISAAAVFVHGAGVGVRVGAFGSSTLGFVGLNENGRFLKKRFFRTKASTGFRPRFQLHRGDVSRSMPFANGTFALPHPRGFPHHNDAPPFSDFKRPTESERRWAFACKSNAWRFRTVISGSDTWQIWSVILVAAALGLWSEKTKWGQTLSAPLVSTLIGLAASNSGLIPSEATAYSVINKFLLPLSVPLLLLNADLKRVVKDTGRLLTIFLIGSLGTTIGTFVALKILPLTSLGSDGWKIAAALMSRHIGGAVNYVAVSEALQASPSVVTAGLAADNLICAIYFTTLFALASGIPPDSSSSTNGQASGNQLGEDSRNNMSVLESSAALAISSVLCACANVLANRLHWQGGSIPCVTALTILVATLFPRQLAPISSSASGLAVLLMQVFFVGVGANGSISSVMNTAPSLFLFSFLQIAVHLAVIFALGKLAGFSKREILLASNANVGGPATGASMAAAKGWFQLLIPTILIGIAGYSIATFLSIAVGYSFLSKM